MIIKSQSLGEEVVTDHVWPVSPANYCVALSVLHDSHSLHVHTAIIIILTQIDQTARGRTA